MHFLWVLFLPLLSSLIVLTISQKYFFVAKQERIVCCVQKPAQEIPWKLLLSKAPVWALIVCHFCHNWGTFILLTWMPTYYNQARSLTLRCPCRHFRNVGHLLSIDGPIYQCSLHLAPNFL